MLPTMCNVTDYVTDYNLCHVIWNQYGLEFVSHLPRSVWGQWHDTSGSMNVYKKVTHKHNDMNISSKINILSISELKLIWIYLWDLKKIELFWDYDT